MALYVVNNNSMLNDKHDDTIFKPSLMAAHLGRLQRDHLLVSIGIRGTNTSFNSMLIDVDADKNTMMIDILHPTLAHEKLMENKRFDFNVTHKGVQISFSGCIKEMVEDDGKPAYLIDFPDELIYKQRRQSFRAPISKDMVLPITLTDSETGETCTGIINNISRGGLCLQFDHTVDYEFTKMSILSGNFHIKDDVAITCDMEIRNITINSEYRHTIVGICFKKITKTDKRHIQNFALNMERKMLKRQRA